MEWHHFPGIISAIILPKLFLLFLPVPIYTFPSIINGTVMTPLTTFWNGSLPAGLVDGEANPDDEHPIFDINGQSAEEEPRPSHFQILSLDWHHVETPFTVSTWILLASVAKILFHVHKQFGEAIPDSALLIVVGLILGYALQQLHVSYDLFTLKSSTFFLYLLPPIIFDAGYFMPNRQLFENWDSVILFAFAGTIWNTLAIGFSLFLLGQFQLFSVPFSPFEILLFASLISAVDPVAVIAVFEEIHVNEFLFINVFGEALFNDGVSVVLYQMFRKFTLIGIQNLDLMDYLAGACSFLVIALGGICIGLGFAFLVSILTRFTSRVKILAPVFVFVIPYLSYLTAELFGMSAILSIVACGIMMKQYVKGNLSHDANQSVKYFVKMLAQCSETAIFMFLGLSTISSKHHWDTLFVAITIGLCLLFRTIGVLVQCALLNRFRNKKFSFTDQFVLCYGGLRGAIAFGLVVSLPAAIEAKRMFVTTCIAVIYFTVFLMGITIRPLLYLLKVKKADLDYEQMMVEKVYNKYFDYTMAGIEDIIGQKGRHFIRDTFERINAKLLKPMLMRNVKRKPFDTSDIVRAYNKITLHEAIKIAHIGNKMKNTNKECTKPSTQSIASAYRETMNGGVSRAASTKSKEIDQYLMNEENADALYSIFSSLLDRKIEELRRIQERRRKSEEDDIKDNYMDILNTSTHAPTHSNPPKNIVCYSTNLDNVNRKMTSPASSILFGQHLGSVNRDQQNQNEQQQNVAQKLSNSVKRRRRSQPELSSSTSTNGGGNGGSRIPIRAVANNKIEFGIVDGEEAVIKEIDGGKKDDERNDNGKNGQKVDENDGDDGSKI